MNTEKQMPIGKAVQRSIPAILEYCETQDPTEFFREFLAGDAGKIAAVEAHMEKHGYTPAQDAMALRKVIDLAHQDVRAMADRYVIILQTTLQQKGS